MTDLHRNVTARRTAIGVLVLLGSVATVPTGFATVVCIPPPSEMVTWLPGDGDFLNLRDAVNGAPGGVNQAPFTAGRVGMGFRTLSAVPNVNFAAYVQIPDSPNSWLGTALTVDAW